MTLSTGLTHYRKLVGKKEENRSEKPGFPEKPGFFPVRKAQSRRSSGD